MKRLLTIEQEKEVIAYYKTCKSNAKTSEMFNIELYNLYAILKRNNVKRESYNSKNLKYNLEAFLDFDSDPLAAYFYGLLLTDGCLTKDTSIRLNLKSTDEQILLDFNKYIGSPSLLNKRTTKDGHTSLTACFKNKTLIERLINQGLTQKKSGNEKLPNFKWIDSIDFFRGMIDGDGCISISTSGSTSIEFWNSLEVVNGFIEFVETKVNIKKKRNPKLVKSFKTGELYGVGFYGEEAATILNILYYDGCTSIARKVSASKLAILNNTKGK